MVDSRKSAQAKRQLRTQTGEFAEENNKSLPSGETLSTFERKRLNNALLAAETNIIMDPDVADCAGYATRRLDELIARPAKPGETDDMPLIIANLRYDPQAPGGSHADYLADHVQAACLCSISCCGFSHDDFSGLGRACRPRNGLNWMVLVSPPERTGKDYDQHAPSTVYPSFAAERGIRRVDRAENTCQRADGA